MSTSTPTIWPCLTYRDAPAAADFLITAFGFEKQAWYTREDDPSIVEHAQLTWPLGGGVMFGTAGKDDGPFCNRPPGQGSVYVVCDDPDALFARAKAAGAEVIQELTDEDYGSRGFGVRDPEGNLWSFGTYRGE
ncbi:glyoxalase [Gordonia amarae]|uniref:VOC domain-containing protein n=2 Tax=Gordonia amarae TaxID=36821 RepID=G7GJF3_9ACTN|nr:VOC family protein [Gordonia amarae]MCS3879100.1 putative glyoxalase superfamily protein PhnB [Gordonia amarae]QHN17631.1 glyoxalase [Gordonia amarae]QHN22157.1 glyoxalase [Gordonia amarae]QHN31038.1 glyoxalase [Gordonia amarae]QHN39783.1 glyoxalase [Gordonia amarae]